MNKKVLLGMSGGVDSSVSAILLKQQGYEVIGATMILWEKESEKTVQDAKKVCKKLGIEHHVIDLRKEFCEKVIDYFIDSYQCAKTPNPCVECNKYIKFNAFYEFANKMGCPYMATGHYAKVEYSDVYEQYVLKKSEAETKDQTYFLYGIQKEILPYIMFPLSSFKKKDEIRKIAAENGLEVAEKKDSQEICFIPNNDYIRFLEEQNRIEKKANLDGRIQQSNTVKEAGDIVLSNGEVVGKHKGLIHYTVGQRKGLGVSYQEPLYVLKLDREKNQVIVGTEKELYGTELMANELNFLVEKIDFSKPLKVKAKIRYRSKEAEAIVNLENNIAKVKFKEPQRAITPGQSIVFYLEDMVLGGGKII